jgi:hypothetical protein
VSEVKVGREPRVSHVLIMRYSYRRWLLAADLQCQLVSQFRIKLSANYIVDGLQLRLYFGRSEVDHTHFTGWIQRPIPFVEICGIHETG